jgi:hypothetical protein
LPAGRIKFGIRAGELRLTLKNGKIPYEEREWNDTFDLSIPKNRQTKVAQKNQGSGKASATSGGKIGIEVKGNSENTEETTEQFQVVAAQVTTKGSEQEPAWEFEEHTGEQVLKGTISNQKLATVTVEEKPCAITATFEVAERDVYISIIERTILRYLLKSKLKPYLSRQELRYE